MKILIIVAWMPYDKKPFHAVWIIDNLKALDSAGIDYDLLHIVIDDMDIHQNKSLEKIYDKKLEKNIYRITFSFSESIKEKIDRLNSFFNSKEFTRIVEGKDIIHSHNINPIAFSLVNNTNKQVVLTSHYTGLKSDMRFWRFKKYYKETIKKAILTTCVSEPYQKLMNSYNFDKRISVVHNAIDILKFKKIIKKEKRKYKLISIGTFSKRKGTDILIKAISLIVKKNNDIDFHITIIGGTDSNMLEYKNLVKKENLEDFVELKHYQTREWIENKLCEYDLFIVSSLVETFSVVTVEAMAAGLPILTTKCNGPESLINEKIGLVVKKNSIKSLYTGLMKIIPNIDMFDSDYIHNYAYNNYSIEKIGLEWKKIYEEI
jgi:L-malate glycosyltransferase